MSDQICGNCKWIGKVEEDTPKGLFTPCLAPLPMGLSMLVPTARPTDNATDCKCWKSADTCENLA